MNPPDFLNPSEEDMQRAIYEVYTKHKGDYAAYKLAIENLALERMPDAPERIKNLFINFCIDIYGECVRNNV